MENNIDHDYTGTDDNKFKKNHPSIIMIKRKNNPCRSFSFFSVQHDDILKKTKNLGTAKTSQESDVLIKILKTNYEFFETRALRNNIDSNVSFEKYVNNICKKASQKLNPLARISSNDSKTKSNHETIYYFAV